MEKANWPELRWDETVDLVKKSVFRIYSGLSAGTGFLVSLGYDRDNSDPYAIIATAWHVVKTFQKPQTISCWCPQIRR